MFYDGLGKIKERSLSFSKEVLKIVRNKSCTEKFMNQNVLYMALKFLCLLAILLISQYSFSQNQTNNWYFGYKAGLSFASGTPVALTNGMLNTSEGCATISNANGNLLFYTDGITIYNRNHQVMVNGTGLMGDFSSSQSAVAFPIPGQDSLYYVFTVSTNLSGLKYSVVNMKKQAGLGEVVQKNIHLLDSAAEKLNAVRHCNNRDVWVITQKFHTDAYYAYLVTPAGVNTTPVVSYTGNVITGDMTNSIGILKCSPDGKYIASAHSRAYDCTELMDFNNLTGQLTNPRKLSVRPLLGSLFDVGSYGVEFSNDSRLLYISSYYDISDRTYIHQFDLGQVTQTAIQASRVKIDSQYHRQYGGMQLGPDGKIYVTELLHNYLSVINNPSNLGTACNFQRRTVYLGDINQHYSYIGLPTFLQSYLNITPSYNFSNSDNCSSLLASFQINNPQDIDSVKWNFGDSVSGIQNFSTLFNPAHIYTSSGIYNVNVIVYKGPCNFSDTVKKTIWVGNVNNFLPGDTSLCSGENYRIRLANLLPGATYLWNDGSGDSVLNVSQTGQYWANISIGGCQYRDTIHVSFNPLPNFFSIGNDTTLCEGQSVNLMPSPLESNVSYLWSTGAINDNVIVSNSGFYWLEIQNSFGCTRGDTIEISRASLPSFSLGRDTTICQTDLQLNAAVPGAAIYQWNTGATTTAINVNQSGIYWADLTQKNCTYRDSIRITFNPYPIVDLGNDTTLCEGTTMILDAQNQGSVYRWQDNSSNQIFSVDRPGKYFVKVTSSGCSSSDTTDISFDLKPVFSLGSDLFICGGQTITLQPNIQNGQSLSYAWQDGSSNFTYNVTIPGIYSLELSNICGSKADSVIITKGACKLYVATAFTPNGDGLNDVFRASYGENITKFKMTIYNRSGEKVFESNDIRNGWNGTYQGKMLTGVFVWMIQYDTIDSKNQLMKGTVSLIK